MTAWFCSTAPGDPSDKLGRFPVATAADVASAIDRARTAFPAWRDAGFEARAVCLKRFRDAVASHSNELAQLIAREVGKALWESTGEATLVPAKVEVTLEDGMRLVQALEAGVGARATYHPRGVLAVLGPFNFPAHLPNGHIIPALATGNTVVFKPSEHSPAVGAWLADAFREARLPDGVLQVVQGGAETGRALAAHQGVDALLFTGSYQVGRSLERATIDQPHKLLALEMGGRNAIVVLDDADLELAVAESALSIAATTGQRCTCASRLFVHERLIETYQGMLARVLDGLSIGAPRAPGVFMGPLISLEAHARVEAFRALASEAGGRRILAADPGREPPFTGAGLVRFETCEQIHAYQRDEIFGPEAALYPIEDLDQAIAAVNDSDYGLVASVFTSDRSRYEHCVGRVRTGLLNWNKATVGASGKLPFGGEKRSGNDRPAGIASTLYCSFPQAHIENEGGFDADTLPPGMPAP